MGSCGIVRGYDLKRTEATGRAFIRTWDGVCIAGKHPVSKALFFNILQGKKNTEIFGNLKIKSYLCIVRNKERT